MRDRMPRGLVHVSYELPNDLEPVSRLFDDVHAIIRPDTTARMAAHDALNNVRYYKDPECIIPRCTDAVCKPLCGGDQWSTPHYQYTRPWLDGKASRVWTGDCDDIELQVAGLGSGRPLFIQPDGENQGHVMHLVEPRGVNAVDYCIPAGMPTWKGPRKCFFWENGRLIKGEINNGSRRELFKCTW